MRFAFMVLFAGIVSWQSVFAFNYQEHKLIGNAAFQNTYTWLLRQPFFSKEEMLDSFLINDLNIRIDSNQYIFSQLSWFPNKITYGDLNGLSGDHEDNPLSLVEDLKYRFSILNRSVLIQNEYGNRFYTNGNDKLLFKTDNNYGFFALMNYNHFYYYGESMTSHLAVVKQENILNLLNPQDVDEVMHKLNKSQSINTYVTLHCAAMLLAEKAGEYYYREEKEKCATYLFYAIIFNAFADHFIEDACASGHLVVNRSYLGSIINNKPLHDFYNKIGLEVVNMQGHVWKEFGDDYMMREESNRETAIDYLDLNRVRNETFSMATAAVTISLKELFTHFIESAQGTETTMNIPGNNEKIQIREAFYEDHCKALQVIPLPFNSHLQNYFHNDSTIHAVERYNWLPLYRNYVRRRVANSVLLDLAFTYIIDSSGHHFDFIGGLRFILSGKKYSYTDRMEKKGTFDQWRGLTISYHINSGLNNENENSETVLHHQIQAGFYRCFDYWIGNTRFLNFHGYLEGGVQITGSQFEPMLTPSVGIELIPLIGFNRKPLPKGVSIPLQFILPLKLLLSYQMISGQRPQWILTHQVDLVF